MPYGMGATYQLPLFGQSLVFPFGDYLEQNTHCATFVNRLTVVVVNDIHEINVFLYFSIFLDHCSTRSNLDQMLSLHDFRWALRNITQMHDPSFRRAPLGVKDHRGAGRACAIFLNSKGIEDGSDGACANMDQREAPTPAEAKQEANNVVRCTD